MDNTSILKWIKENGNIIRIHANNFSIFNVNVSLEELGINLKDLRGRGLKAIKRSVILPHAVGVATFEEGTITMALNSKLDTPPALYFAVPGEIKAMEFYIGNGWQLPLLAQPMGAKWFSLFPPENQWKPATYCGQAGYWLRLKMASGYKFEAKDLVCNPTEGLNSIVAKARQSVTRYGTDAEAFGLTNYSWIGHKAWATWLADWELLQAELTALKSYIFWRHPEFVQQIPQRYTEMAAEAWEMLRTERKLKSLEADNFVYEYSSHTGKKQYIESLDGFTTFVVDKAVRKLPARDRIEDITLTYKTIPLILMADIASDNLQAAELDRQQAEARLLTEQATSLLELQQAEQAAKLAQIETEKQAMRQAAMTKAREQLATMTNPLEEMVNRLRAEMYHSVTALQEVLNENGGLKPRQITAARNLIKRFQLLNTHDDVELEKALTELSTKILPGQRYTPVDQEKLNQAFNQVVTLTHEAAKVVLQPTVAEDYGFDNLIL